jgi:diadenylate cyclase
MFHTVNKLFYFLDSKLKVSAVIIFILVIIVFQDDIRRVLTRMGQSPFLRNRIKTFHVLEEITKAAIRMSEQHTGALIVIEKGVGLGNYLDTGVKLNAIVSAPLLQNIFFKNSPLHDGAVIIQNDLISAAGCVLPLNRDENISRRFGTRHRAAIGITENTDAVAVVVSEETGQISVAIGGHITRGVDAATLRRILHNAIAHETGHVSWWRKKLF